VRGLELRGQPVKGKTVWLVGAGGAGSAIAASLADAGAGRLCMKDVDPARVKAIMERLKRHYPGVLAEMADEAPAGVDFAVNATPMGMQPDDPMPFDVGRLPRSTMVCDIIMKPKNTKLLQEAQGRGMHVQYGQHMMDAQVPMYLEFLGIPFPDEKTVIAISSAA
jgi:shikimate dehydrogenase